ncbi:hypothetical protein D9757_006787 [Collybiopsis confluens]|uniref:Uncharacterized protein n=1 Tax=Collybiopsis confluens TaxID=2823264 RepID=A0A8H5HLJ4_9AGAR|nr:hypothetical protein D9757_006787 [Collybiopsis confluens]
MSNNFSLTEFSKLVSAALEIDTKLDSRLIYTPSISSSSSSSSSSYSTADAIPSSSLSPTARFPAGSPRVLRKIKSLLTSGGAARSISPTPSIPTFDSLIAKSLPGSSPRLKPIPSVSLRQEPNAALFVPYLPLVVQHERAEGSSIFSRRGSDCGSSIVPPIQESDSGHSASPLPSPPRSPKAHRRTSSTSSVSFSAFSYLEQRTLSISGESKHSSLSSCTSSSRPSSQMNSSLSSQSEFGANSHEEPDDHHFDPFAKGQVQVVSRRGSTGSPVTPSFSSTSSISPPSSTSSELKSSLRRKRTGAASPHKPPPMIPLPLPPKRKEPTGPLPLPPRRKAPTYPLPPTPLDPFSSDESGLPSPPITPPASIRDSPTGFTLDWTLGMPYADDQESCRESIYRSLTRRNEVLPRRRPRMSGVEESPVLPYIEQPTVLSALAQRRKDLKPMGHKRTGSPFPLTLIPSRPAPQPPTTIISTNPSCSSAPAKIPDFRAFSPPLSLASSFSSGSSDAWSAIGHRETMSNELAGMVLGGKGLPVPLYIAPVAKLPSMMVTVATPTVNESGQAFVVEHSDDDTSETPIQSPKTPTAGHFAFAQKHEAAQVSRSRSLSVPGMDHKRDRPRQRVPESVVVFSSSAMSLDPFAESDGESIVSEDSGTSYWSARSSIGSFNSSKEDGWNR